MAETNPAPSPRCSNEPERTTLYTRIGTLAYQEAALPGRKEGRQGLPNGRHRCRIGYLLAD